MSNSDDLSMFSKEPFSKAVEQFVELVTSCDALTFLLGAGSSKPAGLPLTKELTDIVSCSPKLDVISHQILNAVKDVFAEAPEAHIEDYLSEIVDLLAIADRRAERGVQENTIAVANAKYTAEQLLQASNQIKRAIANAIEEKVDVSTHQDFITSVHQPVRIGRPARSHPVDYIVLNYDTIIEDALALANVRYADGLYGGPTGWWMPSTLEEQGLSARVIKIHGSIDWCLFPNELSPRRVRPGIRIQGEFDLPALIWPSSRKYQETQLDPFAELMERARKAMRPTKGGQRLLVICGYSFGDNHINLELEKALEEAEGELTVAAFTDEDEPKGRLKKWNDDNAIRDQVLIFANRGFFHGESKEPSCKDLPWWQFEILTNILRGEA